MKIPPQFQNHYWAGFKFCPVCAAPYGEDSFDEKYTCFRCTTCHFVFYQHSSPLAVLIIPQHGNIEKIVLGKRNIEPHKGKLDIPGGFHQYHEKASDAALREGRSETGLTNLEIKEPFGSYISGTTVGGKIHSLAVSVFIAHTVDTYTLAKALAGHDRDDEMTHIAFHSVHTLKREDMAFHTDFEIIQDYLEKRITF